MPHQQRRHCNKARTSLSQSIAQEIEGINQARFFGASNEMASRRGSLGTEVPQH